MSTNTKTKGGVIKRRQNALGRLEQQLVKDTKVATTKDLNGKKQKVLVPLEMKDKERIKSEMQKIKSKITNNA
jgi:hypothetical protein